jgi:hypothetical protein
MEDYIQGIVCGYLTVQNGTRDDAKRRRMFVVLSDSRMDYYLTDPRPEFLESIAETYALTGKTQVHHYAEMNPRAPPYSLCLTTDKQTDVYIAESSHEAERWLTHVRERLEALHQIVIGTLVMRKELSTTQQLQRAVLQTKYTWRAKHVELGRSTLRFCGLQKQRRQKRAMNQFTLTAESYASDEPVEVLTRVALTGFAVSSGALSGPELKKLQRDPKLQAHALKDGGGGLVYPFVVCTGPAHLHLAAASEIEREEWIVAIKLRIIALKYRHNGRQPADTTKSGAGTAETVSPTSSRIRMHDFMEVQIIPGGPWKRRYVELENDMLKVKRNDRQLGSTFETRLLPSCVLTTSLLKANAFSVQNLGQEISLAPGSLQDSQRWQRAIQDVACHVTLERCRKVFHDDVAALLSHSVVYTVQVVAGQDGAAHAGGFVVEKFKKRIFVLSHQAPVSAHGHDAVKIPEGSVLLGISQVGMVHDSFETIWHKLRQKKSFHQTNAMRLTFRAPMAKTSLADIKFKPKQRWTLVRAALRNGKLVIEPAVPPVESPPTETSVATTTVSPTLEIPLRHCRAELLTSDVLGIRNTLKLTVATGPHRTVFLHVHHDRDLFVWYALLQLECAVAQDDPQYPLTLQTLHKLKQGTPSPTGFAEDQRKQTGKCKIAGQLISETQLAAAALEPKLLQRARLEQQQLLREEQLLLAPESPVAIGQIDLSSAFASAASTSLSDDDVRQLFQHLDAIGCGKISSSALASTIDALTRQLEPAARTAMLETVQSAIAKLMPASRQFVSITLEQTATVVRNITDPRVVELVRKFSRHEIQCL